MLKEFISVSSALASLVERRSSQHPFHVAWLSRQMGESLNLSRKSLRNLQYAALLHDIGEIALPDRILDKPGQLSLAERLQMERHALIGYNVVIKIPTLEEAALFIRWHHERTDGTGYPDGLEDEAIPIEASVLSLADVFETLTTDRPFRKALPEAVALETIQKMGGIAFPPRVVSAFLKVFSEHPSPPSKVLLDFEEEGEEELSEDEVIFHAFAISTVLSELVSERHTHLKSHAIRTSLLCSALGNEMRLSHKDLFILELAALLHEVGMAAIPSEILLSRRKLTPEEMEIVHRHPLYSEEIASHLSSFPEVATVVRSHHERYDGKGYPDGLKGEEIPYLSRILAVCSSFEAMLSRRPYRRAMSPSAAFEAFLSSMGRQFDPGLRKALESILFHRV